MSGRKFDRAKHTGFPDGDPTRRWPELLVGLQEIAGFLRVSQRTARYWIATGRLITVKDSRGRHTMLRAVHARHFLLRYKEQKARGIVATATRRNKAEAEGAEVVRRPDGWTSPPD